MNRTPSLAELALSPVASVTASGAVRSFAKGGTVEHTVPIHIVRHGATKLNNETDESSDRIRGWKDVPLVEKGRREAKMAGTKLVGKGIQVILSSDLSRARETAEIIGHILHIKPTFTEKLRPWNLGELTGQSTKEALPKISKYIEDMPDKPVPKGESFNDFKNRAFDGLAEIIKHAAGKKILIVSHHRMERLLEAWHQEGQPLSGDIDLKTFQSKGDPPGGIKVIPVKPQNLKPAGVKSYQEGGTVEGDEDAGITAEDAQSRGWTPVEQAQPSPQQITPQQAQAQGWTPVEEGEPTEPEPSSAVGTFTRHAAKSVLPGIGALGTMGAGAEVGASIGALAGPAAPVAAPVLGIAGALTAGYLGAEGIRALQDKLLDTFGLNQTPEQQQADYEAHPTAAKIGDILGSFAGMSPQQAGMTIGRRALMGGFQGALETAAQTYQGEDFDPAAIATAIAVGGALPGLNRVGRRVNEFGERIAAPGRPDQRPGAGPAEDVTPAAEPQTMGPPAEALGVNMAREGISQVEENVASPGVRPTENIANEAGGNPDQKVGPEGKKAGRPADQMFGPASLATSHEAAPPAKANPTIGNPQSAPISDREAGKTDALQYKKTTEGNVHPDTGVPTQIENLDPTQANITADEKLAVGNTLEQKAQEVSAEQAQAQGWTPVEADIPDFLKLTPEERAAGRAEAAARQATAEPGTPEAKPNYNEPRIAPEDRESVERLRAEIAQQKEAKQASRFEKLKEEAELKKKFKAQEKSFRDFAAEQGGKLDLEQIRSDLAALARRVMGHEPLAATIEKATPDQLMHAAWVAHQQGLIDTVRQQVAPDYSSVTRAPRIFEWMAARNRKPMTFSPEHMTADRDYAQLSANIQKLDHEHWMNDEGKVEPPKSETNAAPEKTEFDTKHEENAVNRAYEKTDKTVDSTALPKENELKGFWDDESGKLDYEKIKGALAVHAAPLKKFITDNIMPEMFSEKSRLADPKFAKYNVQKTRMSDQFKADTAGEWYSMNTLPKVEQVRFMTNFEANKPQMKPWMEDTADRVHSMFDNAYLSELRWGSPAYYQENYFPHLFERGEYNRFNDFMTQQYGPRWFEKHRDFDSILEAMKAGFKLKSTNPMEAVVTRLNASAHMQLLMNLLHELREDGLAYPVSERPNALDTQQWQTIGAPNRTNWILAPDVQSLWKNGVDSKGLWQAEGPVGSIFQGWMKFKNAAVFTKLTLGAFHQLHIALGVAQADNFARGFKFTEGTFGQKLAGGAKEALEHFGDPFWRAWNSRFVWGGKDVNKGYIGRTLNEALDTPWEDKTPWQQEASSWFDRGGMKGTMSHEEMIDADKAFAKAMAESKTAAWLPAAARKTVQEAMRPFFNEWIPNLKRASYYRSAAAYFKAHPEHMDTKEGDLALRSIAKDVDDRYGEMFYGGLFWNRYAKDIGIGSFLSLGWNLGFLRQFGGAAYQAGRSLASPVVGARTGASAVVNDASSKGAYAASYFALTALLAGSMSYAMSGQPPTTAMDYAFPRAGGTNPDGSPRRVSTMFYTRELAQAKGHIEEQGSVTKGLGHMLWNKMMLEPIVEAYNNRDFFGYQLYDPQANWFKQWGQLAGRLMGEEFNPIVASNITKAQQTGGGVGANVLSTLGFGPAPAYIAKDPLQNRIAHLFYEGPGAGVKPYENKERDQERRNARADLAMAKQRGDTAASQEATKRLVASGVNPKTINQEQYGTADVYQFSRLDGTTQKQLVAQMSEDQFKKYAGGNSPVRGKARFALQEEWKRLHPGKETPR